MTPMREDDFLVHLKHMVKECVQEDVKMFNALDISSVVISPRTTKRILHAIQKGCGRRETVIIVKRIVAAFLITISVIFASAMCIEPVRATVWNAIVSWYDKYIDIDLASPNKTLPTKIEKVILPSYIPKNWVIAEITNDSAMVSYTFVGTAGEHITYTQTIVSSSEVWMDNTECTIENINLNDLYEARLLVYRDGRYKIVWENQYAFIISGYGITLEEVVCIAESVNEH